MTNCSSSTQSDMLCWPHSYMSQMKNNFAENIFHLWCYFLLNIYRHRRGYQQLFGKNKLTHIWLEFCFKLLFEFIVWCLGRLLRSLKNISKFRDSTRHIYLASFWFYGSFYYQVLNVVKMYTKRLMRSYPQNTCNNLSKIF